MIAPDRKTAAAAGFDAMVRWRRHLHRRPEVGLELPDTHAYIADELQAMGLDVHTGPASGVIARIDGSEPDGVVRVLRADMDALPLTERSGVSFTSERAGAMHACGHDLHMAMLLGAARALTATPPLRDTVLAFQPGEESDRGALQVLSQPVLADLGEAQAFAIHVNAVMPSATVNVRSGTFMAFGDWFTITYEGSGGHASAPEAAANPIDAAADTVHELSRLVERQTRSARSGGGDCRRIVATVTEVTMGNTVNVIPATGRMRGTIRAAAAADRSELIAGLHSLVSDVAERRGLRGRFDLIEGYPAVVNDAGFVDSLAAAVGYAAVPVRVMPEPSMVIEDFAYLLQRWPGAMVYLGAQVPGHRSFNHSDDVVFDEESMVTGALLHLMVADGLPRRGRFDRRGCAAQGDKARPLI